MDALLTPRKFQLSLLCENDYRFCWRPGNEARLATAEWGETMCEKTVAGFVRVINAKVRGGF